jgi:hypothetical protein
MLHFTIDSSRILLDTAVFSIYISTPFVLTLLAIAVALRIRKVVRDRNRDAKTAPVVDPIDDWVF